MMRTNHVCCVGYSRRDRLTIALRMCHQKFLEALITHSTSADDEEHDQLLTVTSLHSLHLENVGRLLLFLLNCIHKPKH